MEARDSGVRYSREEWAFETRDSIRGKIDHENGGGARWSGVLGNFGQNFKSRREVGWSKKPACDAPAGRRRQSPDREPRKSVDVGAAALASLTTSLLPAQHFGVSKSRSLSG
jgi:hypothetical protein